ncbi:MAG: hypothetical protein OEV78_04410 [Spirochaetia bacterium]|nr:hypothetical protein [Spirochaetia bacterium]
MKKIFFYKSLILILSLLILAFIGCKVPTAKKFNHSATFFPLTGSHLGVNCRECHKDSSLTSLPVDCQSCHPMGMQHTSNLGDCSLCHTTVTFSAPYFNHNRIGVSIQGLHVGLVISNCLNCHVPNSYSGITFTCYKCHKQNVTDGLVHRSPTDNCAQCHSQIVWAPANFAEHSSYPTQLAGAHRKLRCSACHNSPFNAWANINYRDGVSVGSCARCHTRNYRSNSHHSNIVSDANCGKCHGYTSFSGGD